MHRMLSVFFVIAIGVSGCQASLKDQIKGKWLEDNSKDTNFECVHEYLDKVKISDCKQNGKRIYLLTTVYEVEGENLIFTSDKGSKNVVGLKISGGEMQTQNIERDRWVRFTRVK